MGNKQSILGAISRAVAVGTLFIVGFASTLRPALAVTIDWVPVGNPGNANDATGYGAVAYNYRIDKYDVTVGQYAEFLNSVAATDTYGLGGDLNIAGIARNGSPGSYTYSVIGSSASLPITYVNWGDAARFANWLQNGQPTGAEGPGTTETGAYTLNGATSNAALNAISRNANATVFIPSENEWYKAAYYSPAAHSYNLYPFSSSTSPTSAIPGSTPNAGNFFDSTTGYAVTGSTNYDSNQIYLTNVGAYSASASPYGAFDMGGDVFQWTEGLLGSDRVRRGGSWNGGPSLLASSFRGIDSPAGQHEYVGFRVASLAVPEPSGVVLAGFGLLGLTWLHIRNRRASARS